MDISKYDIKIALFNAISKVYMNDLDIINKKIYEVTFTVRLGMYLREILEYKYDYKIDCEYNKRGTDPKTKSENDNTPIRPDIIFHKRAKNNDESTIGNIFFLEAKWDKLSNDDFKKMILSLGSHYCYSYAIGLQQINKNGCNIIIIEKDGEDNNYLIEELNISVADPNEVDKIELNTIRKQKYSEDELLNLIK